MSETVGGDVGRARDAFARHEWRTAFELLWAAEQREPLEPADVELLAESARWGDTYREIPYTRDVEWMDEYSRLVEEFFPYRTELIIEQLKAAGLYE